MVYSKILKHSQGCVKYRDNPFEIQNLLNYGYAIGFVLGILRGVYGKPAIPYNFISHP